MPNFTENYDLKKPLPSEPYSVEDQNENMDELDQILKDHETAIGDRVEKVPGKGLSTNDFTNTYKNKVDQNASDIGNLQTGKVDLVDGKVDASQMPVNVVPIVTTGGSGAAFTATVDGVSDLQKGMLLIIVPHVVSASTTPTLNINGLGAKTLSRRTSSTTAAGTAGYSANWITSGVPLLVEYDGTYWVAIGQAKPSAADLTGTAPVSAGGTGKTSWTAYQLVYPSGTTTLAQLAFPSMAGSILRQGTAGAPYWSTPAEVLSAIGAAPSGHVNDKINTQTGVHGIRWYADKLEFFNGSGWVEIETGSGGGVAPDPILDLSIAPSNGSLKIKWADPEDSAWAGTKVVRKAGSFPTNPKDGTVILDSTTRNAYKDTAFTDSGLTNGTTYYYHLFPYSVSGDYNTDVSNRGTGVPAAHVTFGVRIDTNNSNPETSVTYTDDAIGMTAGGTAWDSLTIFKDIKPCLLKDGVVQYYLNPANFAQKADGSAATITDPAAGDVMIEFPKIGFKITTDGQYIDIKITDGADRTSEGFHYYAHSRAAEGDREKLYLGAYLGHTVSSALCSNSGKTSDNNKTIGAFITLAKARGTGYDIMGFYPLMLVQCLYLIKYKNRDSQTALGRGYVDGNSSYIATGGTNAKGMNFGETSGTLQMKLFGLEDFWGNRRQWIGGLFCNASYQILTAFQNFNDTGSGYTNRGSAGISSNISGYMSKIQGTTETGFVAKECSGSETTHWADYAYLYAGYLPSFGGSRYYGSAAGAFCLGVDYSASYAYENIGARLMYL